MDDGIKFASGDVYDGSKSMLPQGEDYHRANSPTLDATDGKTSQDETDSKISQAVAGLAVGDAAAGATASAAADDSKKDTPDAAIKPKVAVAATPRSDDESKFVYNMHHRKRGMAIVINNLHFDSHTGMSDRVGTDQDASSLCKVFKTLDFEVKLFKDLTKRNMMKLMIEASQVDHKDNDCFTCVILSHGEEGEIYGRDGKLLIDDLVAPFKGDKCRSLAGKPKLFFFQACRGSMLDSGIEVTDSTPDGEDQIDSVAHRIPTEADFLMSYSVVTGYFSWRNSARGSWFIQSLCTALEKYGATHEIMRVMTRVNHKVAYEFESNAAKEFMTRKKQIPCIVSMLTKELYFLPKKL